MVTKTNINNATIVIITNIINRREQLASSHVLAIMVTTTNIITVVIIIVIDCHGCQRYQNSHEEQRWDGISDVGGTIRPKNGSNEADIKMANKITELMHIKNKTTHQFIIIVIKINQVTSSTVFPCLAFTPIDLWLGNSNRNKIRASTRTWTRPR